MSSNKHPYLIFLIILLQSCINSESDFNKIQFREGVAYLPNQITPFTGAALSKYSNGQMKISFNYLNGFQVGRQQEWYENGQLKAELTISNKNNYSRMNWQENGEISKIINVKDGQLDGFNRWKTDQHEFYFTLKNGMIDKNLLLSENNDSNTSIKQFIYKDGRVIEKIIKNVNSKDSNQIKVKFEYDQDSSKVRHSAVEHTYSGIYNGCSIKMTTSLSSDKSSIIRNQIMEDCEEKSNGKIKTTKTPNSWESYQKQRIETYIESGKFSWVSEKDIVSYSIETGLMDGAFVLLNDESLSVNLYSQGKRNGYSYDFNRVKAEWDKVDMCLVNDSYEWDMSVCNQEFGYPVKPEVYLNESFEQIIIKDVLMAEQERVAEERRILEERKIAAKKKAEQERVAEKRRILEERKIAAEKKAKQERLAEERRELEERRIAAKKKAKQDREAEEQRIAEEKVIKQKQRALELENAKKNGLIPIVNIEPKYPVQAARDGKEGYVIMSFTINEVGSVEDIEILEAVPERIFNREAKRALRKWKYMPKIVEGKPQKQMNMEVRLDFKLHK